MANASFRIAPLFWRRRRAFARFTPVCAGSAMTVPASLISELEEVIQRGTAERRAQTLSRIARLFLPGASQFNEDHVRLFDGVLTRLIDEIETKVRAELSQSLAPVGNAPVEVIRRLAKDDDITVAGPVLEQS